MTATAAPLSRAYCGQACRSGACALLSGGIAVPVESVVTAAFFNGIKSHTGGDRCPGKNFYTLQSFLEGARANPDFAKGRSKDDSKREMAAFFAQVTHETRHLCIIEEINGASQNYCDERDTDWPCVAGMSAYYGRGPLQLRYNNLYGPAGKSIGVDLLRHPEKVAQDPVVVFKVALWFWMGSVHPYVPQGFGATTRAVSGIAECDGGNSTAVNARAGYYRDYCKKFGVDPGNFLTC